MDHTFGKKYPVNAKDYKLYEEVGEGVSATVYRALCVPLNEIVAIKVLDLEKCNNDLDGVRREVQTMSLINHTNVLRAHCSFTTGHNLWVVMPYMAGGSCLHIMKTAYPEGFEEPIIATLLREVLKALVYLHSHGHIHRDVKAGNILLDSNGAVKLGDFGVSACMFDTGDRQRSRNTFVGTPCWMAPEVMQQLHGYDFKADIWSFGITALELAHGHAPFSKYPPMKVLLMTLQNAPPGLDYERDKRFSKSFKDLVAACLVKDPKKRPTSEKLLKHQFFKHARSHEYLSRTILDGLPPLGDRFRMLKAKEADLLGQNRALYGDKEQLSQQKYMRGISAWNFNLEDLKNQAALIQDIDGISNVEDSDAIRKDMIRLGHDSCSIENLSLESDNHPIIDGLNQFNIASGQAEKFNDNHIMENSLSSFPIQPLQALKGYFDVAEDDASTNIPDFKEADTSDSIEMLSRNLLSSAVKIDGERNGSERSDVTHHLLRHVAPGPKKFFSGSLVQDNATRPKRVADVDREGQPLRYQSEHNYSGPLFSRQRWETSNFSVEDASERAIVQRKGRFKVTSSELSPKVPTNSVPNVGSSQLSSGLTPDAILPALQSILQQNAVQREELIKLIKRLEQNSGNRVELAEVGSNDISQTSISSREQELHSQVIHMQKSVTNLLEELQQQKLRNAQLEKQLSSLSKR